MCSPTHLFKKKYLRHHMKQAIILDWDGVFYQSLETHFSFIKQVCRHYGLPFNFNSLTDYRAFLSRPVHYSQYFIDLGVKWNKQVEFFSSRLFARVMTNNIKVFTDLLELINEFNLKTGLVTSSYREVVLKALEPHGFSFNSLVCNRDAPHKPRPDGLLKCINELGVKRSEAVFIGDMISDAQTAINAGVDFIGVSWPHAYNTRESLEQYANIGVVDSVESLKKTLLPYIDCQRP